MPPQLDYDSHLNSRLRACTKVVKLLCRLIAESGSILILPNTCIPMMAYMKKSITINKHTYGKAYNKIITHGELIGHVDTGIILSYYRNSI